MSDVGFSDVFSIVTTVGREGASESINFRNEMRQVVFSSDFAQCFAARRAASQDPVLSLFLIPLCFCSLARKFQTMMSHSGMVPVIYGWYDWNVLTISCHKQAPERLWGHTYIAKSHDVGRARWFGG